jgi:predicted HicB family RNase H-like nuclease
VSDTLQYKDYLGSADVDVESGHLHGKLLFIRDTITYTALTVPELEVAFREAVEEYLATCEEEGDGPDVPCKGSFNVRVGPDRHRTVAIAARRSNIGLNEFVCQALDVAAAAGPSVVILHRHEHVSALTGGGEPKRWTILTGGPFTSESDLEPARH